MKLQDRTLRIIGGNWRGRKVTFAEVDGIRPTAARIRETLFNWLMHDIAGARCVDLYAGSGILSMEALSRGASHVTLVDRSGSALDSIRQSFDQLGAHQNKLTLVQADVTDWLKESREPVDLVFMDPPFDADRHYEDCALIAAGSMSPELVYIESRDPLVEGKLPDGWRLHRQKSAGAVHYGLCRCG